MILSSVDIRATVPLVEERAVVLERLDAADDENGDGTD